MKTLQKTNGKVLGQVKLPKARRTRPQIAADTVSQIAVNTQSAPSVTTLADCMEAFRSNGISAVAGLDAAQFGRVKLPSDVKPAKGFEAKLKGRTIVSVKAAEWVRAAAEHTLTERQGSMPVTDENGITASASASKKTRFPLTATKQLVGKLLSDCANAGCSVL